MQVLEPIIPEQKKGRPFFDIKPEFIQIRNLFRIDINPVKRDEIRAIPFTDGFPEKLGLQIIFKLRFQSLIVNEDSQNLLFRLNIEKLEGIFQVHIQTLEFQVLWAQRNQEIFMSGLMSFPKRR